MEESTKEPLPWGVSVVALLFGLGAAWQFFSQTWPALTSGDPTLLSKSVNVVLDVFLIWGLVTRQNWAWWLSLVVLSVNVATSLFVIAGSGMASFGSVADSLAVQRGLGLVGLLSLVGIVLLLLAGSRRAFLEGG